MKGPFVLQILSLHFYIMFTIYLWRSTLPSLIAQSVKAMSNVIVMHRPKVITCCLRPMRGLIYMFANRFYWKFFFGILFSWINLLNMFDNVHICKKKANIAKKSIPSHCSFHRNYLILNALLYTDVISTVTKRAS